MKHTAFTHILLVFTQTHFLGQNQLQGSLGTAVTGRAATCPTSAGGAGSISEGQAKHEQPLPHLPKPLFLYL